MILHLSPKAGHKSEQSKLEPKIGKLVIISSRGNALLLVHNRDQWSKGT